MWGIVMENAVFTYLVIFKSHAHKYDGPISLHAIDNNTMHLFDEEMYSALDAIEFLMHMPRNIFDLYDIDEHLLDLSHDTPHHIILVPDILLSQVRLTGVTMFLLADDCSGETKQVCEQFCPTVGVHYVKDLTASLLETLWINLYEQNQSHKCPVLPNINHHFLLKDELIKALPTLFLSRQFNDTHNFLTKIYNSTDLENTIIQSHWNYLSRINTLLALGEQGVTTLAAMEKLYAGQYEKEFSELQANMIITFPGIPKRQKQLGRNASNLSDVERRIIRILGVHRAIARNGILIELPCAKESLFQKYDTLEESCKNGTNNKFVWRSLNSLGKDISHYFTQKQNWLLRHAKDITIFSDFPIGIVILGDDEVPLQCYKSISYQPLTPLTRRVQQEILKKPQCYLGDHCKIAIAECIPNDKENKQIYQMGELLCSSLSSIQKDLKNLQFSRKDINSIEEMKRFIADNLDADILYISAHGYYDRDKNLAGIVVGNQRWMASENLFTPPIVILSACHTAPRGFGCISIADMFLRNGALAVLGTFIPVNAQHNMILMTRLFVYIAEAQRKSPQYKTLSDAWSGIVASNAIHELMATSERFQRWMHEPGKKGISRIEDFQLNRCVGRLRQTHIYSDTITILKELLEDEGMAGKFDNIISQNDYFPESFFYQLLGCPENIYLYNETFAQLIR